MRATSIVFLVALTLGAAGCPTNNCKPGTVFLTVDFGGDTAAANFVDLSLAIDGGAAMTRTVSRTPGAATGTIEISFASAYPSGHTLALDVVARQDSSVLGDGSTSFTATPGCDDVTVALGSGGGDGGSDGGDDLAGDLGGADMRPMVAPQVCSADHWCWVNPLPTGNGMIATWGFASNDVWAVGDAGTILHWDGSFWSSVPSATQADLWSVWGIAANDVWAGGQGVLVHWDGAAWTVKLNQSPANETFVSIWGAATNNVYAVGADQNLAHWDGTTWTLSMPGSASEFFTSVGGTSASDVWIVGSQLWHSTGGTTFTVANPQPPTGSKPISLYAPAAGNLWLVGIGGSISNLSGGAFTPYSGVTSKMLEMVWGTGGNDVWAAGSLGTAVHWNGSAWNASYSTGTTAFLWGGWSASPSDAWLVGDNGTLIEFDGASFKARSSGFVTNLADVWGSAANDVWAVGSAGKIYHFDGTSWSAAASGTTNDLSGVWGSGAADVWAVGLAGTILHWTGAANGWQSVASGVTYDLGAVWGSRSNDVWAVGTFTNSGTSTSTTAPILHWNGSAWSGGYTYSSAMYRSTLAGVHGASTAGQVWAVGNDNSTSGANQTSLFASYPGSGTVWNVSNVANTTTVSSVWAGTFATFAVGSTSIFSYNGTTWSATATPGSMQLNGLYGFADNDVYAVGLNYGAPSVLHWNGSQWSPQVAGVDQLLAVWGSATNDVWSVGGGGAILHKTQ